MFFIRCLKLLWIVPCSWIDALLVRNKTMEVRSAHMRNWSKRLMKAFHSTALRFTYGCAHPVRWKSSK